MQMTIIIIKYYYLLTVYQLWYVGDLSGGVVVN